MSPSQLPSGNTSPSLMYASNQHHRTTFKLWKIVKPWWPSVICGDFNAHHVSWDEYAQGMPRGAELYNWVEQNEMAVLNDGKPTRAARFQQGCGLSAPDITIINSEAADRFSWQPLNELSSDHSPILIKWNQLV